MSLGGRLSALKKKVDEVEKTIECDSLVVGSNLYSLEVYAKLKEKNESVKLVSPVEFSADSIRPFGPSSIRGKDNISVFKKLNPHKEINTDYSASLFFKDQKWRPFGGRSKSEMLQDGEEFYISPRTSFDWKELFSVSSSELIQSIMNNCLYLIPLSISYEEGIWSIKLSAGTVIRAKKLFWGEQPTLFTELFSDESKLPPKFLEYADTTSSAGQYFIKLLFSEPIGQEKDTIFIPLSYTHDWGHYIGEFDSDNPAQIEFLAGIDLEQSSEDEVAKRIKMLKRSLNKIYPDAKSKISNEYISVFERGPSTTIEDKFFNEAKDLLPGLSFIGENAAIDETYLASLEIEGIVTSHISHLCRALISIRQSLVY